MLIVVLCLIILHTILNKNEKKKLLKEKFRVYKRFLMQKKRVNEILGKSFTNNECTLKNSTVGLNIEC